MASRLLIAGLLQYSRPLYDQIEEHLLKVYAAAFMPALEATVADAEKRLKAEKERVARVRELIKKLGAHPTQQDMKELIGLVLPLALAGVLKTDLKRLMIDISSGKTKGLLILEKDMDRLEKSAQQHLGGQAEEMRKDLERWREFYDEDVAKELEQLQKSKKQLEPLVIKLKPEQFPFLRGKFEDNVKKVRGEDAGLFDDMKEIKVYIAGLEPGHGGFWSGEEGKLVVGLPPLAPLDHVLPMIKQTVRHELTHATQTVMARALGVRHLRRGEDGGHIPLYRPGPGMAPKEALDPEIHQAFRDVDSLEDRVKKLTKYEQKGTIKPDQKKELEKHRRTLAMRQQVISSRGLKSPAATYSLDDMEFYTHLADRITEFEEKLAKLELTPEQKALARDLWTARKWVPQKTEKKALAWIAENDPTHAVWPHFTQGSPFFRHLKKYQPKKYQKAVKEFVKATEQQFEDPSPSQGGGLQKLWDEFLEERYEGGKKKVPNPNSKTKERYPDISVNYLMKQTDSGYGSARQKIRREFARWRYVQRMPAWMRGPSGG
jgi:hypothetical protein